MEGSFEACSEAADWLRGRLRVPPKVGLVCGSGLGALAQEVQESQSFPYGDIPNFPRSTVPGHEGRLVVGLLGVAPCAVLMGRFHLYEGYSPQQVVVPIRVLALLGVHTLVLTNAAGSLRSPWAPGHLLVIRDHIDLPGLAGRNPLVGPNDDRLGPRFPSMAAAYDPALLRHALQAAPPPLCARPGVYVGVGGPSYETPAECGFLRGIGGDAVGMSTVQEAVAARHCGLRLLGLSLITNAAPGGGGDVTEGGAEGGGGDVTGRDGDDVTGHEEVLAAAQAGTRHLRSLLVALAPRLATLEHA
ncbi:purine nucleoside phosphorylase-like [Heliangelus exortis]|uniref:purine nucleoside phosphorylase-like n=1 Tax=Heliangelus exortis TaxID=472823 RepID=UPI003A9297D0